MVAQCRPLIEVLAELPDGRKARGKRHPLTAILALVCVASLCGYRTYSAIAQWARIYPAALVRALGFTHRTPPCAATLHTVLRHLDRPQVEARLGAWAESVLAQVPPAEPTEDEAIAIDGKALRGSRQRGAPQAHLLSALSHRLGLTLGQRAVADKTNEITQIVPLLQGLVLEGRIFTMDALLTQRLVAQTIVEGDGDYVLYAKGNQRRLEAAIERVFATPPAADEPPPVVAATTAQGHGRLEQRRLTARVAQFTGRDAWPGLHQVFQLERETQVLATGKHRHEVVYGLTSLVPRRADPDAVAAVDTDADTDATRLLGLTRHQWHIENRSHYVRDVTFDEDRSQVRCGSIPQVLAAFRNTAIGLLRLGGERNIAAACRRLAAQPQAALALLGIISEN
jgi:predicted transposase YbfD/YdcC